MKRKLVATALAAAALSVAPLAASPAHADERECTEFGKHFGEEYAQRWEDRCRAVISVTCFPGILLAPCTW